MMDVEEIYVEVYLLHMYLMWRRYIINNEIPS